MGGLRRGVCAIIIGCAGYILGTQAAHREAIRRLQVEASGNLAQRIEALSLLRMADSSAAIAQLEGEVAQLATTIVANPEVDRHSLSMLKSYLSGVPANSTRPELHSLGLDAYPLLAPRECPSALRALLQRYEK